MHAEPPSLHRHKHVFHVVHAHPLVSLGNLKDYVDSINAWNVRVLKKPALILDTDYEIIYQKLQDDMEDLAEYEWDTGGRFGYLNTVKKEFHIWNFDRVVDQLEGEIK